MKEKHSAPIVSVIIPVLHLNRPVNTKRFFMPRYTLSEVLRDLRGNVKLSFEVIVICNGHDPELIEFVRTHAGMPSNYHYVLMHGAERTILIKHQKYPYKLPSDMGTPKWLYFSSVGDDSLPYHQEIAEYLTTHPTVKLAFQPGTFQIKLGKEALKDLYAHTEIFFCNVEEARIILGITEPEGGKLPKLMSALGPKIAVVTDGPKGAYA